MIVPKFWAESRVQDRVGGRQVTVRRFGWSDTSQDDAQANADKRAREAFARIAAGEAVARRERKVSYNGADGVPIREEIVSRHGTAVITRNIYGTRCLNTPDVLFADIDFEDEPSVHFTLLVIGVLTTCAIAVAVGWNLTHWVYGLIVAILAAWLGRPAAVALHHINLRLQGGAEKRARHRIDKFIAAHPDWHLRLYRTPAGLRLLAMHQTFDPRETAVAEFFKALGTDPIYVRMCLNQNCFRARVSPKPWRVGIVGHIRPRPGVWPVNPERLPERARWIEEYEQAARNHASCQFIEAIGSGVVNSNARTVQVVHDQLCQAASFLPIA
jgi:hypothetical protein